MENDFCYSSPSESYIGGSLSIVVPLYNEEKVFPLLLARILASLKSVPEIAHEIIFVDDGSSDGTNALLESAATQYSFITIVSLSRNFGQQMAFCAGIKHAKGDMTVLMDGDLQDPPELIPALVNKHRGGFDVVTTVKRSRQESWWLRACYNIFYKLLKACSVTPMEPESGDFCLLSRKAREWLMQLPESHFYLRGLRSWIGFKQDVLYFDRPAREAGNSHYTVRKLFALALDGLVSFSVWPLRAMVAFGMIAVMAASIFTAYSIALRLLTGYAPTGFTAIVVLLSFMTGVNMMCLGVVGEYVGRIYEQVKQRPKYIVKSVRQGILEAGV